MLPVKIKDVSPCLAEKSAIIISHPDDEVLWFSSVLKKAHDIVIVFNDYSPNEKLGIGRQEALKNHPCKSLVTLAIDEPISYDKTTWSNPTLTDYGVQLQNPECDKSYQETFNEVVNALTTYLTEAQPTTVFTHNPWGEYGHEDHIQIYRALEMLQASFGFQLLVSCYSHSKTLMKLEINKLSNTFYIGQPNLQIYQQVKQLYLDNDVWTWHDNYVPPKNEYFFSVNQTATESNQQDSLTLKIKTKLCAFAKRLHILELNQPTPKTKRSFNERVSRKLKKQVQKLLKIA